MPRLLQKINFYLTNVRFTRMCAISAIRDRNDKITKIFVGTLRGRLPMRRRKIFAVALSDREIRPVATAALTLSTAMRGPAPVAVAAIVVAFALTAALPFAE